ncbi:MAG TPA: aldehyde dehydrogenase family protein, partial [bacterium]|nr:aldehyde dehydrogenase family protein [bacterium]
MAQAPNPSRAQRLPDTQTNGNGSRTNGATDGSPLTPAPPERESVWDYAPAPEDPSIANVQERYQLFIGGQFVEPKTRKYFPTINPATEEPIAQVAEAGPGDIDRAVEAARTAYEKHWRPMEPKERTKYIFRIARVLQERAREFAVLESLDGGKPIKESRDVDVPLAAAHFFYYAGWADKLQYAFPGRTPRAIGVCGQIIPWNFPL